VRNKFIGYCITVFVSLLVLITVDRISAPNSAIGTGLKEVLLAFNSWRSDGLLIDIVSTVLRVFYGFCLAAIMALLIGILTGRFTKSFSGTVGIFNYLRAITPVALAPFFLVAFGIGEVSKVLLIVWGAFFPIWVNVHIGIVTLPKDLVHSAHLLGLPKTKMITDFYIPAAFKAGYPGARVAIGIAFILVFVSETLGAESGVGYKLGVAYDTIQTPKMAVALIILGCLGFVTDRVFAKTSLKFAPWLAEDTTSAIDS